MQHFVQRQRKNQRNCVYVWCNTHINHSLNVFADGFGVWLGSNTWSPLHHHRGSVRSHRLMEVEEKKNLINCKKPSTVLWPSVCLTYTFTAGEDFTPEWKATTPVKIMKCNTPKVLLFITDVQKLYHTEKQLLSLLLSSLEWKIGSRGTKK